MRRKYNTLNEEMNRMKSLFGESRLYGNLVDSEDRKIISEQWKFFNDLSSAWKLSNFKRVGVPMARINKFLDYTASNIPDILKYVTEYKKILKNLVPSQNWDQIENIINTKINKYYDDIPRMSDKSFREYVDLIIRQMPEEGGIQDVMVQMVNNKRYGGSSNLPAVTTTREIAVTTKGEIVIATKNADGTIVYRNEAGEVVPPEQIKLIDGDTVEYYDIDGNRIDPEEAKTGEYRLFDKDGNEIDIDGNKKITDWEEGMDVYDDNNEYVGTYNDRGELIDRNGNVVDKDGNILIRKEDRIEDAVIVDNAEGSMGDLNNKTVKYSPENIKSVDEASEEAIKNGGVKDTETTISKEAEELIKEKERLFNERQMAHEERMKDKEISAEQQRLEREKFELEREKFEEEKKRYEESKKKGEDLKQSDETKVNITREQHEYVSNQLETKLRWDKRFSRWFAKYMLPLKITGEETVGLRVAKHAGSSTVDPLGLIYWMREYKPRKRPGIQKPSTGTVTWRKTYRTIAGSAFNVFWWNFWLFKLWEDDRYSMTNIFPTYWENIKYNWITKGVVLFAGWWVKPEMESFCNELKNKTGKTCEEWTNGWKDFIEPTMNEKLKNLDCSKLKEYYHSNNELNRDKVKELATEISKKWNDKLKEALDIGWIEKWVETIFGWQTELAEVGTDVFMSHEIEIGKDNDGESIKVNAIDYYLKTIIMEKCKDELQEGGESDEGDNQVVVEEYTDL
jgi:hypothetical protein